MKYLKTLKTLDIARIRIASMDVALRKAENKLNAIDAAMNDIHNEPPENSSSDQPPPRQSRMTSATVMRGGEEYFSIVQENISREMSVMMMDLRNIYHRNID